MAHALVQRFTDERVALLQRMHDIDAVLTAFQKNPEIEKIDATPDPDYPLRILQAYRSHCAVRWTMLDGSPPGPALQWMNQQSEQRAKLLDRAIATLLMAAEKSE